MKKILLICFAVLFAFSVAACDSDTNFEIPKETDKVQKNEPPKYMNPEFSNVDAMLEWINTTNIETFQEGRYKNGITELRQLDKIPIPTFLNLTTPSPKIVLMPDDFYPDGKTVIGFYYPVEKKSVVVFVKLKNDKLKEKAEKDGINSYLEAQYGQDYVQTSETKATIGLRKLEEVDSLQGNMSSRNSALVLQEKTNQEISYSIVVDRETSSRAMKQVYFFFGDFEIKLIQPEEYWEDKYLTNFCLEEVELNSSIATK